MLFHTLGQKRRSKLLNEANAHGVRANIVRSNYTLSCAVVRCTVHPRQAITITTIFHNDMESLQF